VRGTSPLYRLQWIGAVGVAVLVLCRPGVAVATGDEGWVIERLHIALTIQPDGVLSALEALDVDFRGLQRRGIFRDMAYLFTYNDQFRREYEIDLVSVTSADGRTHQVRESTEGALRRFRIGDPNRTISGKETYRLAYQVRYALNAFPDHDELYWSATGTWPVPVAEASVSLAAPAGAITRVDCFQGPRGSTERCVPALTPSGATFTATRPLKDGEQLTVAAALRKRTVPEPRPKLVPMPTRARDADIVDAATVAFESSPLYVTVMVGGFVAVLGGAGALWWRVGRDRQYVALHRTGAGGEPEERVPLFGARPIAVEFQPPDRIRPGQMGLLIDERADTLDVTATIVDLAGRGYLRITELPKDGWFSSKDWQIDRLKPVDANLLEYERILLDGLFESSTSAKLSKLKNKFYEHLADAKRALYRDAVDREWFPRNPGSVRTLFRVGGILVAFGGAGLAIWLGARWGAGFVGLPVVLGGILLAVLSGAMPRRTAAGRELFHRTLGFARYIRTAERHQQAFAERAGLFTEYLPYAVAFRAVDQWARAFAALEMQAATAAWYVSSSPFTADGFTSTLDSFSSSVSSAIASTPGGSGGSGFSGGSSGGGGGGGGGGSW